MLDWLLDHSTLLAWGGIVSLAAVGATLLAIPWIIIRLPVDYFCDDYDRSENFTGRHPVLRWVGLILKNLAGLLLVVAGIAMLVLPGQGVLSIVIGIMLMNFPGKRRLERWLVTRESVFRALNWIRHKAGRPPLEMP